VTLIEVLDMALVPSLTLWWLLRVLAYWRRRPRASKEDKRSRAVRLILGGIAIAMLWTVHGKMQDFIIGLLS